MDISELLRALPTRDEIRLMLGNIEETHRKEAQDLRGEIATVQTRMEAVEAALATADNRMQALEAQARRESRFLMMQDMEDQGRRNNLRLRRIPEAAQGGNVVEVVQSVLQHLTAMGGPETLKDAIRAHGGSYRWGYPFRLLVRKRDLMFALHHPDKLPQLFEFLEMDPLSVPNCLAPILPPPRRNRVQGTGLRRDRHPYLEREQRSQAQGGPCRRKLNTERYRALSVALSVCNYCFEYLKCQASWSIHYATLCSTMGAFTLPTPAPQGCWSIPWEGQVDYSPSPAAFDFSHWGLGI